MEPVVKKNDIAAGHQSTVLVYQNYQSFVILFYRTDQNKNGLSKRNYSTRS
jgi:hypothetical protein